MPERFEEIREPPGRGVQSAVGAMDARADESHVGPAFEQAPQPGERALAHHHIGVAYEQIVTVHYRCADVDGCAITEVGARRHPFGLGVALQQRHLRAVRRTVVRHDYDRRPLSQKAPHARQQVPLGVVVDDDAPYRLFRCVFAHGLGPLTAS